QVALLDPDPVLAGQYTANLNTKLENVTAELLGALDFARLVRVVEDQRVQIAVAGMEYIGDPQPMPFRQRRNLAQHLGEAAARDRAVHAVIIGRDAPHGWKRRLAPGPEQQTLGLGPADAQRDGAVRPGKPLDDGEQMVDLG